MIKSVNVIDLKKKLEDSSENIVLVDCRELNEWREGHISSALFIPLSQFESLYQEKIPQKESEIYIICRSGRRSLSACQMLSENGYSNLTNVEGGILDWSDNDFEIVEGD